MSEPDLGWQLFSVHTVYQIAFRTGRIKLTGGWHWSTFKIRGAHAVTAVVIIAFPSPWTQEPSFGPTSANGPDMLLIIVKITGPKPYHNRMPVAHNSIPHLQCRLHKTEMQMGPVQSRLGGGWGLHLTSHNHWWWITLSRQPGQKKLESSKCSTAKINSATTPCAGLISFSGKWP